MVMNWDAIGAIGEILGAIAVFASLIYLAAQIRNQNRESRMSSMHDIRLGFREILNSVDNSGNSEIMLKAIADYDSLTPPENLRLIAVVTRVLHVWEEAFLLYDAGDLAERMWVPMLNQFSGFMSLNPYVEIWAIRKQYFDSEFQKHVDGIESTEIIYKTEPA